VEEAGDWNIVSGQLHCPVTQSGCRVATVESFDDTAFVIENWTAEAFVIRKGGEDIATGAAPNRPWANAFYDAAHQRLVFQYLPDIEPDEPIEQRTFEVTMGGGG